MNVPFNKPVVLGNEEKYLLESLRSQKWSGRGPKTLALEKALRETCKVKHAYMVTSGSSALEVGCLLADLKPGDEVILPSFGFVSAANAVVLRGARPVFADIDRMNWNISLETVESLVTSKTRGILPVHYSGSSAGIEDLRSFCEKKNIFLIEDAAQSLGARRNGQLIGPTPWVTCFSLHDTKNVAAGEGGLLMTDNDELSEKIEVIIEKGTNRQRFFKGQVDKYTWVSVGSSYIASDLLAAVALAQFEKLETITSNRRKAYEEIKRGLGEFEGKIQWQEFPEDVEHNGHVAGFVMDPEKRQTVLSELKAAGIAALFHYVPLHDSPFAKENGLSPKKDLPNTRWISEGLVRLPIFASLSSSEIGEIVSQTAKALRKVL